MILDKMSNLQQRVIMGSLSIICLFVAISLSYNAYFAPIFALLAAGVISLALGEFYHIARAKGLYPQIKLGILSTIIYGFSIFLATQSSTAQLLPFIILALTLVALFLYYCVKGTNPLINLSIALFGLAYLTIPLSFLIAINYFISDPFVLDGRWCLLYLLLVTKITDIGAYFIGKKFGNKKLAPKISPEKTWEGAIGGLCSAILTSVLMYFIFHLFFERPPFNLTFWQSLWLATLISITGQFGDLTESLLKRDTGVKDSSNWLPGMGGFLDLVDSLIFTAPLMYLFLRMNA